MLFVKGALSRYLLKGHCHAICLRGTVMLSVKGYCHAIC